MNQLILRSLLLSSAIFSSSIADAKVHLFLLSGQSNMGGLNPDSSFTPTVKKAFSEDKCIVVKRAQGGQPIRRWYKQWKPEKGDSPSASGDLYDKLIKAMANAVGDHKPDTITFVWMQGERDAKEKHGSVYAKSLQGLIDQLSKDLGRKDLNFVIGRLSDFGNQPNRGYADWETVRKAQVQVAEDSPLGAWVDTDDLNGKNDGLHYDKPGYVELGRRFAEASIKLVNQSNK